MSAEAIEETISKNAIASGGEQNVFAESTGVIPGEVGTAGIV